MKIKLLLTFIFLILLFSAKAQRNFISQSSRKHAPISTNTFPPTSAQYDSIYYWRTDSTRIWRLSGKSINRVYDANKNLLEETIQSLRQQTWKNSWKYLHTFDANNNKTLYLQQFWDNNDILQNYSQTINKYANNQLTETINQLWDTTTKSWSNSAKQLFTYDNSGNELTQEYQRWTNASWVPEQRYVSEYNSNGLLSKKSHETYKNSNWVLSGYYSYTYDANKNLIYQLRHNDDASVADSTSYTYVNNNLISTGYFIRDITNTKWEQASKSNCTYDSNDNLIYQISYMYFFEEPYAFQSISNIYNSLQQLTDETNFILFDENTIEVGDSSHYFIHTEPDGILDFKNKANPITIYPNPSNGTFTIMLENKHPIEYLEIYNVIGECVLRQRSSNTVSIPNVLPGIYFVRIDDGTGTYTKKITVQ